MGVCSCRWLQHRRSPIVDPLDGIEDIASRSNVVLVEAAIPGHAKHDTIVFEVSEETLSKEDEFDNSLESSIEKEKSGRFWSQNRGEVGTWILKGNALQMCQTQNGNAKVQTAIAVSSPQKWINQESQVALTVIVPSPKSPWWFTPGVIATSFHAEDTSSHEFECPVCSFELYRFPQGFPRKNSKRSCSHYFHLECGNHLLKLVQGTRKRACCLTCGVGFTEMKEMPNLLNEQRAWFMACDLDGGGTLDPYEVIEALGSCLPMVRQKLTRQVYAMWRTWDPDGDGSISMQEFLAEGSGLRDWLLRSAGRMKKDCEKLDFQNVQRLPSLEEHPVDWFEFWDRNASGGLTRDELVRALIHTFCHDANGKPSLDAAFDMRESAASLWAGLGYAAFEHISVNEFMKPFGLMDQFIHNQTTFAFFGLDADAAIMDLS